MAIFVVKEEIWIIPIKNLTILKKYNKVFYENKFYNSIHYYSYNT